MKIILSATVSLICIHLVLQFGIFPLTKSDKNALSSPELKIRGTEFVYPGKHGENLMVDWSSGHKATYLTMLCSVYH